MSFQVRFDPIRAWAISQTLARYARAFDCHDLDLLSALFATDAVLVLPSGTVVGRDAIRDEYAAAFRSNRTTKHIIANIEVDDDGGTPTSTSSLLVTGWKNETLTISWGTYRHTYVENDGTYLFRTKEIALDVPFLQLVPVAGARS